MGDRAYSLLHVKALDADQRTLSGLATSPVPDRLGDIVDPSGITFRNPLPLLMGHDKAKPPVGWVRLSPPTEHGVRFEAQIARIADPGPLQDHCNMAWQLVKSKLISGVSIGFRALQHAIEPLAKSGGVRFKAIEILELSLVAIPAHQLCTIDVVRSVDQAAASGQAGRSVPPPGASGPAKANPMMTISEQLTVEKTELQTKSARLEELERQDESDGGLNETELIERDGLLASINSLTAKVKRLTALEEAQAVQAKQLTMPVMPQRVSARGGRVEVVKPDLPKGTHFTRYALSVAAGKGSYSDTLEYAKRFTDTPEIAQFVKALWQQKAVEGTAVVASPGWGGELVNPNTAMTEFVELLMPLTILGRTPGFRRVPFNIPIITQTGGSTFEWVGEGAPKPVGELAFERTTLGWAKCAGIVVLTEELIRLSSPNAEERARGDLTEQCAKFLDEQFIQAAITAGASNPASITNGVAATAATGTDLDAVKADLVTALGTFTTAGISIVGLVFVTTPDVALGLSMITDTLGQAPAGFTLTPNGGTLLGYTTLVSESVDAGTIVIFKPSEIFLADDGQVRLDASNQATLDMNGGSPQTPVFSLWQRNCVGLRAERWINWRKRRPTAVALITGAAYGPGTGSP